jgi:hypothetical protein
MYHYLRIIFRFVRAHAAQNFRHSVYRTAAVKSIPSAAFFTKETQAQGQKRRNTAPSRKKGKKTKKRDGKSAFCTLVIYRGYGAAGGCFCPEMWKSPWKKWNSTGEPGAKHGLLHIFH